MCESTKGLEPLVMKIVVRAVHGPAWPGSHSFEAALAL